VPAKPTFPPEKPICPAPVPSLRIETLSSASRPVTVSVPVLKFPSGSVNTTAVSSSCGDALTVFSENVTGESRPARLGASFTAATLTILVEVVLGAVPSLTTKLMVRFDVFGVSEVSV
jgi:hypothetical protein